MGSPITNKIRLLRGKDNDRRLTKRVAFIT